VISVSFLHPLSLPRACRPLQQLNIVGATTGRVPSAFSGGARVLVSFANRKAAGLVDTREMLNSMVYRGSLSEFGRLITAAADQLDETFSSARENTGGELFGWTFRAGEHPDDALH